MDPRARKILFAVLAAVLLLVGFVAFMNSRGGEEAASRPADGGAVAPIPAPDPSRTDGVEKPSPDLSANVRDYLQRYFTFTWETPQGKWEEEVRATGATGDALRPPFFGPSLQTCVRSECGYRDISVSQVEYMGDGVYTADVEATFFQSGGRETRGTWACTVLSSGASMTSQTCLGVA